MNLFRCGTRYLLIYFPNPNGHTQLFVRRLRVSQTAYRLSNIGLTNTMLTVSKAGDQPGLSVLFFTVTGLDMLLFE